MHTDLGDVRKGHEVCVKIALDSKCQDEQVFAEVRALNQARLLGTHPVRGLPSSLECACDA